MRFKKTLIAGSVLAAISTLSACGGSDDSDTSTNNSANTSETVYGRITAFGSIFVNGVEYETDNATITVDGQPATEDDLELGMMVTVHGDSNGNHGNALIVDFSDDVEGVITAVNLDQNGVGTITVMGYTVTIDTNTMVEIKSNNITSIEEAIYDASLSIQYVAEVSGHSDGEGSILATRVEVKGFDSQDGEIELKGFIKNLDMETSTFMIADIEIVYDETTEFDDIPDNMLADDIYVEVKGYEFDSEGRLVAHKIEHEGEKGVHAENEDDEVEIEGLVGAVTETSFELNGQTILINESTEGVENLSEGALVEVEAYKNDDGDLVAHKVEYDELDDEHHDGIEIKGQLESIDVDASTITIMGTTMKVDTSTLMIDDHMDVRHFDLLDIDLSTGTHYVEVKAYYDDNGDLVVSKFCYEGIDTDSMDELEGPVTVAENSVSVAGISIDFGIHEIPADGTRVELKGTYTDNVFYVDIMESSS